MGQYAIDKSVAIAQPSRVQKYQQEGTEQYTIGTDHWAQATPSRDGSYPMGAVNFDAQQNIKLHSSVRKPAQGKTHTQRQPLDQEVSTETPRVSSAAGGEELNSFEQQQEEEGEFRAAAGVVVVAS